MLSLLPLLPLLRGENFPEKRVISSKKKFRVLGKHGRDLKVFLQIRRLSKHGSQKEKASSFKVWPLIIFVMKFNSEAGGPWDGIKEVQLLVIL